MSDYWKTCVEEAFAEIGITATQEQTIEMVKWIEGAHKNYGMAHGHECIPNPPHLENGRLAKLLKQEQEKVHCKVCGGSGSTTSYGPHHNSHSRCWKCKGEGKHAP